MDDDVTNTHLCWGRLEREFVGRKLLGGRNEVLRLLTRIVTKSVGYRVRLRGEDSRQHQHRGKGCGIKSGLHGKTPCWGDDQFCALCRSVSSSLSPAPPKLRLFLAPGVCRNPIE